MEESGEVLGLEQWVFSLWPIFLILSLNTCSHQAAADTFAVQPPEPASKSSRLDPRIAVSSIGVSGLVFAVFLAVGILQILRRRLRRGRSNHVTVATEDGGDAVTGGKDEEAAGSAPVEPAVVREFNWEDIRKMTANFGEMIGSGGFSTVYMGRLAGETDASSGVCAVKVHSGSERLNIAFRQELDILLRIRHQNIVKLIGFCDEEGALIFSPSQS
ncbi:hypothetical protein SAY86_013038 [Trapa natans]|uniref:Protein kinase domain-containing protein n=1 Tax=Trapa natans TaxID=22666 RepID=A0AAN7M0P9_TRANT|nr:hypothetical protein SAY86_013038 [Trapa natans]